MYSAFSPFVEVYLNNLLNELFSTQTDLLRACRGCQLPTQIFKDHVVGVTNTVGSYVVRD